jgi:hypothetical protein
MTRLTMSPRAGGFILSEAAGYRSREQIIVAASQTLLAGAVLGAIPNGDPAVTPGTRVGTGDGAIGAWTADAGVPAGEWAIEILGSGATAAYRVLRPDGSVDGVGAVGSAYNGGINGTLADGTTDWGAGTRIPMTVAYDEAGETYVKHDPEGTNGSQVAKAILFDAVTTGVGETTKAAAIVRSAEVVEDDLVWDDHTDGEKAAALAQLATTRADAILGEIGGIIARAAV